MIARTISYAQLSYGAVTGSPVQVLVACVFRHDRGVGV